MPRSTLITKNKGTFILILVIAGGLSVLGYLSWYKPPLPFIPSANDIGTEVTNQEITAPLNPDIPEPEIPPIIEQIKLVERIDEKTYRAKPNAMNPEGYNVNWMPYNSLRYLPGNKDGDPVMYQYPYGGQACKVLLSATDDKIASSLNITIAQLYCLNGSARIFYGNDLNNPTAMQCFLAKWNGYWHLGIQISTSLMPLWIAAIIAGHVHSNEYA